MVRHGQAQSGEQYKPCMLQNTQDKTNLVVKPGCYKTGGIPNLNTGKTLFSRGIPRSSTTTQRNEMKVIDTNIGGIQLMFYTIYTTYVCISHP